ncbi:hypothetical protein [Actinoplanes sp. NPDC049118]|uniref:hypothetical protein n=1 Tax=Actinoplanes sp. NPDC049118 TaxID=3155769 RepID=UPI0033E84216
MTEHGDQLRRAFETHENGGPDPAEVYARVQQLARGYLWRRRGAQAAGGAVLGVGLIAGVMNLPALLPAGPNDNVAVAPALQAGAPAAAQSATPSASAPPLLTKPGTGFEDPDQDEFDAYFGAGYDYDDAVKLASVWKKPKDDIGAVKAEAGRRLLAGETLPVKPGEGAPQTGTVPPSREEVRVEAFFAAGYDYDDAVKLAKIWKSKTPYAAKVAGGKKLLAGETLPIRP